ncbi:hypothetical protein L1887_24048 [Cichorium endivia]|nr:hypothetical protein L1887_24048 [Cichorium endivia]
MRNRGRTKKRSHPFASRKAYRVLLKEDNLDSDIFGGGSDFSSDGDTITKRLIQNGVYGIVTEGSIKPDVNDSIDSSDVTTKSRLISEGNFHSIDANFENSPGFDEPKLKVANGSLNVALSVVDNMIGNESVNSFDSYVIHSRFVESKLIVDKDLSNSIGDSLITNNNAMKSICSEVVSSAIHVENCKAQGSIASKELKLIAEDSLMDSDGDRIDGFMDSESNPSLISESKLYKSDADEVLDGAKTVPYSIVDDVSMDLEDNRVVKDNAAAPLFTCSKGSQQGYGADFPVNHIPCSYLVENDISKDSNGFLAGNGLNQGDKEKILEPISSCDMSNEK